MWVRGVRQDHIKCPHGAGLWVAARTVAKPLGATWVTLQAGRSCPLVWVPAGSPCRSVPICPPVPQPVLQRNP